MQHRAVNHLIIQRPAALYRQQGILAATCDANKVNAAAPLCHVAHMSHFAWLPGLQVKVCVIDSGVNRNHGDLAGNIAGGWNR